MPVTWEPTTARYRGEDGRFVSRDTVLDFVRQSIETSGNVTKTLAERVSSGQLSSREFLTVFKQEIKDEYIRQYVAGRGGVGSMAQKDWGKLGSMLKTQYAYADGFSEDLENLTEGQIRSRSLMYINSSRQAYEQGQRRAISNAEGFTQERWMLNDSEHCADCSSYAALGWVDIGTIPATPADGSTQCKSNCKCFMQYK